ncbi:hypothetical protein HAX54_043019 [Datura stramonium]|uniref:Uncharacterized protein n=1 Tax=Datura stramonium TaxID=4076 RepID=A0ABS8RSC5_DATST|nr:hypothetical protein [Datura stramonium]
MLKSCSHTAHNYETPVETRKHNRNTGFGGHASSRYEYRCYTQYFSNHDTGSAKWYIGGSDGLRFTLTRVFTTSLSSSTLGNFTARLSATAETSQDFAIPAVGDLFSPSLLIPSCTILNSVSYQRFVDRLRATDRAPKPSFLKFDFTRM